MVGKMSLSLDGKIIHIEAVLPYYIPFLVCFENLYWCNQ